MITGTIKANFPDPIGFQVTSKIDLRTIMGEQGFEQLLGMGDLLYMAGGGRIYLLPARSFPLCPTARSKRWWPSSCAHQGEPRYVPDVSRYGAEDGRGEEA